MASQTASTLVCSQCREPVAEDARNCPHCGHDAGESAAKAAWRVKILTGIAALTIVGWVFLPVLVPVWLYHRHKATNATVGVEP